MTQFETFRENFSAAKLINVNGAASLCLCDVAVADNGDVLVSDYLSENDSEFYTLTEKSFEDLKVVAPGVIRLKTKEKHDIELIPLRKFDFSSEKELQSS